MNCPTCGIELKPLTLAETVEREERYRENYPNTWDEYETIVLCEDCAQAELEQKPEWER